MNQDFYITLLHKQLAGSISLTEQKELDNWLVSSEENKQVAKEVRAAWKLVEKMPEPVLSLNLEDEYALLESRINVEEPVVRPFYKATWFRAAAAILILFALGYLLQGVFNPAPEWQTTTTASAEKRFIEFPDGSKIWLNENSKLKYQSQFGEDEREVFLEGQAYISVTPNPSKPFTVITPDANVRVLGTIFDVKNYSEDSLLKVHVVEGKVSVEVEKETEPPQSWTLVRDESVTFDKILNQGDKRSEATPNAIAWHTQTLVFDDTPLNEVILTLEKHFEISIILENTDLGSCPFSLQMKSSDPTAFLDSISGVFSLKWEKTGTRSYKLTGGICP